MAKATGFDAAVYKKKLDAGRAAQEEVAATINTPLSGLTSDMAWSRCRDLAEDPCLVERLLNVAMRLGVAGDRRGVLAAFLVAVSRLLDSPARMLRKGAAASGKSYVIEAGLLPLLNPSDYVIMTAGSAKALIYSERDFRHCLLIIPEAAALASGRNGGDEFAMMLRELISAGHLAYSTVHPDAKYLSGIILSV